MPQTTSTTLSLTIGSGCKSPSPSGILDGHLYRVSYQVTALGIILA